MLEDVFGVDRDDLIEQYMDYIEDIIVKKRGMNHDRSNHLFFHVTTEDVLYDVDGQPSATITAKVSENPLTLREVGEFLVDNVGKVSKINIVIANN